MSTKKLAVVLAFSLAPVLAHAQGFVELGLGQATIDLGDTSGTTADDKDTTWAISGGYMFHPMVGAEIGYRDLGEASVTATGPGGTATATAEVKGFMLGLVGRIPVGERFSIVPRFGFYIWDADATLTLNGTQVDSLSDDGTDPYFGIGAQFDVSKQANVGLHFARFDIDGDDVDVLELKVGFRF